MTTTTERWQVVAEQMRALQPDIAWPDDDDSGEYHPWMRPRYRAERDEWEKAVNALADFFAALDRTTFNRRAFELACGYNSVRSDGGTFR